MMKNWVSHILFLRKRGLIVNLEALWKDCVSYKQMYVPEVLANPLVKLDQEKCDFLTDYPDMIIAGA